jgi:hypothetical protein
MTSVFKGRHFVGHGLQIRAIQAIGLARCYGRIFLLFFFNICLTTIIFLLNNLICDI